MTQAQYDAIMRKVKILEDAARFECGCYIQECIADVVHEIIKAKSESENATG